MYLLRGLILQIQFFTSIPLPFTVAYDDKKFVRTIMLLPLVGLLIGSLLAGTYSLVTRYYEEKFLAVIVVMIAEIVITGGLHLDGLADSCDGLFSHRTREEILVIMKDSCNGSNALLGVISLLSLKAACLFSVNEAYTGACLFVMPVYSRMAVVWSAGVTRYARKGGGMGRALVTYTGLREIVMVTICTAAISWFWVSAMTLPFLLGVIAATLLFSFFVTRRIGGSTGDTLGASIEITEVVFLWIALSIPSGYCMKIWNYIYTYMVR
jgi:adenosylcobinamide-GDP ribazoletransferase